MNINNVIEYIKSGLGFVPEPKLFRKLGSGSGILTFLVGLIPGIVLGGYWMLISIIMIVSFLITMIVVYVLSAKELTVKNRLILQVIICLSWIWQMSLLVTMFYTMAYGINIYLFLLNIPTILIPLLLSVKASKKLKKDTPFNSREISHSHIRITGSMTGIIGMNLAAIFRNVGQNTAIIIVLSSLLFLTYLFSFGLLSIQRLYYLYKLDKLGMLPKEFLGIENSEHD